MAQSLGCVAVVTNYNLMDAALISRLHGAGLRALCYTVNDPAEARRLVALVLPESGQARRTLEKAGYCVVGRLGYIRLGRWRWVVERTFAWLNQFRRLRVRYDKGADIHEAFLSLGCALICWRSLRKIWMTR